jgi:hypothetical protein
LFFYSCGDCDAPRYQIVEKKQITNEICDYKANALTTCAFWESRQKIIFTDSCSLFLLSQVVDLKDLDKYK